MLRHWYSSWITDPADSAQGSRGGTTEQVSREVPTAIDPGSGAGLQGGPGRQDCLSGADSLAELRYPIAVQVASVALRPAAASTIASPGPCTAGPPPAVPPMSEAQSFSPDTFRFVIGGQRDGLRPGTVGQFDDEVVDAGVGEGPDQAGDVGGLAGERPASAAGSPSPNEAAHWLSTSR